MYASIMDTLIEVSTDWGWYILVGGGLFGKILQWKILVIRTGRGDWKEEERGGRNCKLVPQTLTPWLLHLLWDFKGFCVAPCLHSKPYTLLALLFLLCLSYQCCRITYSSPDAALFCSLLPSLPVNHYFIPLRARSYSDCWRDSSIKQL